MLHPPVYLISTVELVHHTFDKNGRWKILSSSKSVGHLIMGTRICIQHKVDVLNSVDDCCSNFGAEV